MSGPDRELFEFDSFRLDPAEHRLLRDGEPVPLEPKVFETLLALVRRRGSLVAKDELMQAVWPDSFVEESNLTRNISVLRKALSGTDGGRQYIETVPKRGYRFVGDVRAIPEEQTAVIVQSAKVTVVVEEEESDEATTERGERPAEPAPLAASGSMRPAPGAIERHKTAVVLALSLALVALAAAAVLWSYREGGQPIDSFAVLPFVNVGADPEMEYLSDGITDSLIDRISQAPGLKVMSHNSVFRYKGREVDAQAAGRELGVRAVLTGRVVIQGDSLSVFAELVDVRDNSRLWGGRYHRNRSETLALQADLSRDISERLQLRLSGEERQRLTKRATASAEAYELYLKGRYYTNTLTEEGIKSGLGYFQRAIEIDPEFAPAHAGLAEAYTLIGDVVAAPAIPPDEAIPKAKAAASRALELDETLAGAHTSLARIAMVWDLDLSAAEGSFKRAIALNPNDANAYHWYSHYLIAMGRFDESLAASQQALALDPLDVAMNAHLGFHFIHAREYDRAIAQLQKTLEMNPSSEMAHGLIGAAYEYSGRYDEAIAAYRRSMELGSTDLRGYLGRAYAVAGRGGEARRLLDELLEESTRKYVSPYNVAVIYAGLGETDQALAWLEKAYGQRDSNIVNINIAPEFAALRSDPRFVDLLERIGLAPRVE
jgi:DNA-binding winged helix-turn-helix (wHTH) protein/TolB-like protein/Flp pilus assembly protein TadD